MHVIDLKTRRAARAHYRAALKASVAKEHVDWLIAQDKAVIVAGMKRLMARVGPEEMAQHVRGELARIELLSGIEAEIQP